MGPAEVERLSEDDRVIKYAAKLQAVVTNAQEIQEVADQHGSFGSWVESAVAGGVPSACAELSRRFAYISKDGARNWLYSTGHDVGQVTDKVREKYAPYRPA